MPAQVSSLNRAFGRFTCPGRGRLQWGQPQCVTRTANRLAVGGGYRLRLSSPSISTGVRVPTHRHAVNLSRSSLGHRRWSCNLYSGVCVDVEFILPLARSSCTGRRFGIHTTLCGLRHHQGQHTDTRETTPAPLTAVAGRISSFPPYFVGLSTAAQLDSNLASSSRATSHGRDSVFAHVRGTLEAFRGIAPRPGESGSVVFLIAFGLPCKRPFTPNHHARNSLPVR